MDNRNILDMPALGTYQCPIRLEFTDPIIQKIDDAVVDYVVQAVQHVTVGIDKTALLQALQADKKRYEEAYNVGYMHGQRDAGPKLVPCSLFLPGIDERVLCITKTKSGKYNCIVGYHDGTRWCCGMNSNVVYWQPLPKVPDEGGVNNE